MDVTPRVVESPDAAAIAIGLFHLLDSPEIPSRGQARLFGRQPAAFVLVSQQFKMPADFFVEGRIHGSPPEHRRDAHDDRAKRHDDDSPSIRLIIATVRDQRSASIASCFRPARVIE